MESVVPNEQPSVLADPTIEVVGSILLNKETDTGQCDILAALQDVDDVETMLSVSAELYQTTNLSDKVLAMSVLYARGMKNTDIVAQFGIKSQNYVTQCVKKVIAFLAENPQFDPSLLSTLKTLADAKAQKVGRRALALDDNPDKLVSKPKPRQEPVIPAEDRFVHIVAFNTYMKQIQKIPMLSPEENIAHAYRIQSGYAAQRRLSTEVLDDEEKLELRRQVGDGAIARERMIEANLRFVIGFAKRREASGMPLLDLIQAGNIGLIKAVEQYVPDPNAEFSTYAAIKIRREIKRTIEDQLRVIRLPVHIEELLAQIRIARAQFSNKHSRQPYDHEISEMISVPADKITKAANYSTVTLSLDPVTADDDLSLYNTITSVEFDSQHAMLARIGLRDGIWQVITDALEADEVGLLTKYFGLDGNEPQSYMSIDNEYNIPVGSTGRRMRAILNKLRDPKYNDTLRLLLD